MFMSKMRPTASSRTALLAAELPILLVTLGLLSWALHVLAQALHEDTGGLSFLAYPPKAMFTYTRTQTVTGYRTSSVEPAYVSTRPASTYYVIGQDHHTTPHTNKPYTFTASPITYGIGPTGTKTRVATSSGIQEIGHYVVPTRLAESAVPSAAAAAEPTAAPIMRRGHHARQQSSISSGDGNSGSSSVRLNGPDFWDLSTDAGSYTNYATVTINHGFEGHFFEAGINYLFDSKAQTSGQTGGYSDSDLARIRALIALDLIALIAILGRLSCSSTTLLLCVFKVRGRQEVEESYRRVLWPTLASTILLFLTYVPFWAIYGSWTNRNATVKKADAVFQADTYLQSLSLQTMLSTSPWKGAASALIVFWTLSVLTSIVASVYIFRSARTLQKGEHV